MAEKRSPNTDERDMFTQWTATMTDIWGNALRLWVPDGNPTAAENDGRGAEADQGATERIRDSVTAALKNWQTFSGALSEPGSLDAIFKGMGAMPEVLAQLAQTSLHGFVEMQQKILDSANRIGDYVDADTFAHLDENFFETWTGIYEKEIQRYLKIPKLGLVREYQERISESIDAFNRFQVTLNEFMRILAVPVSRSFVVLQEQLGELADKGELPEDGRAYYDMWIKVLEGHYMTLFQTPEYTDILGKTLSSLTEYKSARNAVIEDMLDGLPIPTRSEIDSLYQEIHRLKRRLRALEKNPE
ncbi:MAG: poly(R)-hydroxyalkanoic acid synthase subunit PhaE [Desulfobacterales bacterium]|nr:poly(R)-hydroxyalkanoic acid synthase subunit PhaE [Desulfobacterales bacterium]MDJ0887107.1 poly(R)-hydroxyalkanoic acid synthase subunit PhaE [Desulfobacterales bacterium]MDJ0989133.1 poly(R)-hydroxyalkanoic acid synthase subunit PhaE [Desulfobacterales bacterium]